MLLHSTDTYHVACALEVVLSQGKRQEKTRFNGQDVLDVTLLDLSVILFCHPPCIPCKFSLHDHFVYTYNLTTGFSVYALS